MLASSLVLALALAAQPGPRAPDVVTGVDPATLPAAARAAIEAAVPGMRVAEIERKEREGRVYLDVEGVRPDGEEVEIDMLVEGDRYTAVEIQRDVDWTDAPAPVRSAAARAGRRVEPVRVIESRQTDGAVIYELFAEGAPERPSLEIKWAGGAAEVLAEEWPH